MAMSLDCFAKAFCQEMSETKTLLRQLLLKAGGGGLGSEDLLVQYPESTTEMYLAAGASYQKTLQVNRKLYYFSIDAPEGVTVMIYRDGVPLLWSNDEIGALELKGGLSFGTLEVRATNNAAIQQKWGCRFIFS